MIVAAVPAVEQPRADGLKADEQCAAGRQTPRRWMPRRIATAYAIAVLALQMGPSVT